MGIAGALRCQELLNLTLDDIEDNGTSLYITINDTKTNVNRAFHVFNFMENTIDFMQLYKKYTSLRPPHINHKRFFIYYKNGKCSTQVIGKNSLGKIPSIIANYLHLPNANLYTGHCIRRTSATMLSDSGASLTTVKRHGGWKSTNVAEGYIETSKETRMRIAQSVLMGNNSQERPSTSTKSNINENFTSSKIVSVSDNNSDIHMGSPYINIINSQNITITINK